jgi:Protein of unknown function (DUF4238)
VAKSYLKLWCDPNTPQGAPVWVSPKDRLAPPSTFSPKKLFVSSDMNTLNRDGERNLLLENAYQKYETSFGIIKNRLFSGSPLTQDDHSAIVAFVSIQMIRTPKFRSMWGELEVIEASRVELAKIEDVKLKGELEKVIFDLKVNQNPLLSIASLPRVIEVLGNMRMVLLRVDTPFGFITSDSPACVIEYKDKAHAIFERLESSTCSVLMPLGPSVLAVFSHSLESHEMRQLQTDHNLVHETNAIIWKGAQSRIVLTKKSPDDVWFSAAIEKRLASYCIL